MQAPGIRKSARLAIHSTAPYYGRKRKSSTTESIIRKPAASVKRDKKSTAISAVTTALANVKPAVQDPQQQADTVSQGPAALVQRVTVYTFDMAQAVAHLRKVDPKLGSLMTDELIAAFVNKVQKADSSNPFRELATAIIYQQLSGKVAEKIEQRFIDSFDPPKDASKRWFPAPERVIERSVETLKSVGLSTRKAEYIKGLAEKFVDKTITAEKLQSLSDEEISNLLCSVRGIGQWTADMYLMLNLGHPDILPVSDLGVRKGVGIHFELKNKLPGAIEMEEATNIWRPYRSVGSWFMWKLMEIKTMVT